MKCKFLSPTPKEECPICEKKVYLPKHWGELKDINGKYHKFAGLEESYLERFKFWIVRNIYLLFKKK